MPIGPKEAQVIALRLRRAQNKGPSARLVERLVKTSQNSLPAPPVAQQKVKSMKTAVSKKTKTPAKRAGKAKGATKSKNPKTAAKKPATASAGPDTGAGPKITKVDQLKTLLAEAGGKTAAEVGTHFGWKEHTARAAISGIEGVKKVKDAARGGTVYSLA